MEVVARGFVALTAFLLLLVVLMLTVPGGVVAGGEVFLRLLLPMAAMVSEMEWMVGKASIAESMSYAARHISQSFGLWRKIHVLITLGHAKSNAEAHHTKRCVARCGLKLHTS